MRDGRAAGARWFAAACAAALGACAPPGPGEPSPSTPTAEDAPAAEPVAFSLTPPPALPDGATLALTRASEVPLRESSAPVATGEEVRVVVAAEEKVVATWVPPSGPPWARWLDAACAPGPDAGADPYGQRVLRVPQDHATMQEAIDAAEPGDTVRVAPGVYTERVRLRSGVRLVGSGAHQTIFDAQGAASPFVEFSGARDVVVAGFTFRNVGRATGCGRPDDPFVCSGDWYSPAIYGDGHDTTTWGWPDGCATSALIAHNVFEGNDIAVMAYFHARVVVRNNVFVRNVNAVIANHFQDSAVVESNVFWENAGVAVGSSAAYLDVVDNVIARSGVGIHHEFVQTGRVRCNVFFENGANATSDYGARFEIGRDGNLEVDPGFVDAGRGDFHPLAHSSLRDAGCFEGESSDPDGSRRDVGAYGGPLAGWVGE